MTKRVNKVELFHIWLLICSFHSVRLFTTFCVDLYVYQQIEVKLGNNPKVPKSRMSHKFSMKSFSGLNETALKLI